MVMTNAERQAEFRARRKAEIEKLRNAADAEKQALAEAMLPILRGLYEEGQTNMATVSPTHMAYLTHQLGILMDNYIAGRPLDHKRVVIPTAPGERHKPYVPEIIARAKKLKIKGLSKADRDAAGEDEAEV